MDQSVSHLSHNMSSLSTLMTSSLNPAMNASLNTSHPFSSDSFIMMNKSSFHANTADTTSASADPDDSAQSILDAHVSTVWDSSTGQTPSRSPGRHSPDRIIAPAYVDKSRSYLANTSSFNSNSSSKHHHSKRTRDKDASNIVGYGSVDPPEALQQYYSKQHAQSQPFHHHRGSSADAASEIPHTTRRGFHHTSSSDVPPPLPLRGATHHWDEKDSPATRGRTRDPRRSSSALKKTQDSSCNIEDGLPGDVLLTGSNDPQSRRYVCEGCGIAFYLAII